MLKGNGKEGVRGEGVGARGWGKRKQYSGTWPVDACVRGIDCTGKS